MDNDRLARNVQLLSAIEKGELAKVIKHLNAGAEVDFINFHRSKNTPLHDAVAFGHEKIVEILLEKGASPDSLNEDKKTPAQLLGSLGEKKRKAIGPLLGKFSKKKKTKAENTKKQPVCESPVKPSGTFAKRQGTAAAGQQYESKLLTMVLFQLLHNDQVESFYLGSNLDGIGALDDIVLKTHVRGKSRLQFVQCKHRKEEDTINFTDMIDIKNTTGDFHLYKYFESYRKICSLFDPDNSSVIFQEKIKDIDIELIIITPATITFPKYIVYIETNGLSENINTVETGKIWQVKYSEKIREIFETIHRKKLIEFLAQLLFLPEFQIDLEEAIEKLKSAKCVEIFNDLEHSDRKKYFKNIQVVKNTIKDADLKTKIDMIDERFTTESLLPSGYSIILEDFFNKLRLYTKQATEDELKDVVVSMIKLKDYEYEDALFFKTHEAVQKWWASSGQVEYLTESCDFFEVADNECKLDKIHSISTDWLQKYYVEFRLNMLIKNPKWINLHEKVKEEKFYVNIYSSTSELCCTKVIQLLKWHKNEFKFIKLNNTEIDFLIEVLSKGNKEHNLILVYLPELNCELVEKIRQKVNKLIVISTNGHHGDWLSLSDTTKNILELKTEFQEKLLETKVTFQGNSIPLERLMERAPKQLIDAETIKKLVTNEKITISLDFTNSGQFYIQRDLLEYRQNQLVPRKIDTVDDKVVIVTAGPGIGKSMMLTGRAAAIKSEYPSSWIVRINLLQHSTLFDKWTNQYKIAKLPKSEVFNFLLKTNNCETSKGTIFEENIFKWYCEQYKLVLLVDGFDEVSPDYTTIVLQLLQSLKDNFADTLWVTTRTGTAQTVLEENLEVCAHLLKPFSLEESKIFLRHFWIEIDPHHKYVRDYVDKLDSHFSQPTNQGEHKLITIPLHTSMIGTKFKSDFKEYCKSNGTQTNFEKYDLLTIYESFINFKFNDIFMEQKNKFKCSQPQTKILVGQIYHEHKLASIYALFNIAYATKLLSKDEIRIVECLLHSENVLKAGIISHIKDEKPTFVHQTYAEFFVAKFIWEKYSAFEIDKFESFVDLIFIKNFVEGDRSQITHFLLKIAQSEEQNDVVKVSKACVLLDQLLSLKLCSQAEFSKRSISFLLGIVECSIPEKGTEGFAKFKSIVNKKPKSRNILLLKAAENGYLKLVRLTMDDS
ncbi:uncharacterized protein LOC119771135, partial [Culex quinquefasciatus]|uniref:uncharacterized protein LOC119771135 n=1 Tax=Culex quinquefasciatus TaxID=7176 RepID=UPI0018E3CDAD